MAKIEELTATRPFKGTWKGRAGTSTEYLLTSNKLGKRVHVQVWEDTGEIVVRAIDGDGRTPNFREFYSKTTDVYGVEAAAAEAAATL